MSKKPVVPAPRREAAPPLETREEKRTPAGALVTALLEELRGIVREEVGAAVRKLSLPDEYLTLEEAAGVVKVDESSVKRWVSEGVLARYGHGRMVRVLRRDLDALMRQGDEDAEVGAAVARLTNRVG